MKNTVVVCPAAGGAEPPQRASSDIPPAKLGINMQTLLIAAVNSVLPHLFLLTGLPMGDVGGLIADTHVRAPAVVEQDEAPCLLQGLLIRCEAPFLAVDALIFDGLVHALCNAVVGGLVVLRHGDLYAVLLQFPDVEVTAVLHATVGVMDESREVAAASLVYGHAERLEREYGCQ